MSIPNLERPWQVVQRRQPREKQGDTLIRGTNWNGYARNSNGYRGENPRFRQNQRNYGGQSQRPYQVQNQRPINHGRLAPVITTNQVFDPKAVSWSSFFNPNPESNELPVLPKSVPVMKDGYFEVPVEIYEKWSDYVVGFFVETRVPFLKVKEKLESVWKLKADFEMSSDRQLFYFRFKNQEDKRKVLEMGPSFVAGKIFFVLPWTEEVEKRRQQINVLPIWVKIYQVPKQMWTEEGLAFLASLIGTPLYTDKLTKDCERLDFAKRTTTLHLSY